MATNKNPFVKAHYEKIALNKTNEQKLRAAYKAAARDVKQQLDTLKMINPSDSLKKVYLENLTRDINKSIDSLNRVVQNTIQDAGVKAGSIAVDAGNSLMKQAGLTITGAYSYVPRQEVFNIVSGKLYGQGWNLSQAIWKSGSKMKSDIEKVVGVGLAGNKPIKDIADDLMKYVDPTARKPWDWSKVYPGTAAKVDYNAQRLARTMIQHSFQRSLVQSQRYNPFCNGIIWYSVGIHGRTCELCLERDGQVFPVKDLPLDHPNGLCYFEPALWKMDDIADRLGDWVNGNEDAAIETYITKGLGLKKSAPEAKKAIEKVKTKASPTAKKTTKTSAAKTAKATKNKPFNASDFIDENFKNLKKKVIQSQKTEEAGEEIWGKLRQHMLTLDEDHLKYMSTGDKHLKAILPSTNGRSFYRHSNGTITMDFVKDLTNSKGEFSTFFHEYGHLLDHNAAGKKHTYFFTDSEKFRKTLYSSLEKEYNKMCKKGKLLPEIRSDLLKSNSSSGVQDIISGVSMNENRVKWGHSTEYWIGKDQQKGVVLETVAHFNTAMANPQAAKYFEEYFPESYKLMKEEMQSYLKNKGLK